MQAPAVTLHPARAVVERLAPHRTSPGLRSSTAPVVGVAVPSVEVVVQAVPVQAPAVPVQAPAGTPQRIAEVAAVVVVRPQTRPPAPAATARLAS